MTTVAYCAASPEGRTDRHQIWMRPDAVPGLRRLTDAVHAEGAAVCAQIGHAGPVANAASNRLPALAPTRRLSPLSMRMIKAASASDLQRITRAHAQAAVFAREARASHSWRWPGPCCASPISSGAYRPIPE